MSTPRLRNGKTAAHLFRALLRECTYLPDPRSRAYVRKYVVDRFRKYHPSRAPANERRKSNNVSTTVTLSSRPLEPRTLGLLQQGQKGLEFLRRANAGRCAELTRVLRFTYGRLGRRRRELLGEYLVPEVTQDKVVEDARNASLAKVRDYVKSVKAFTNYFAPPLSKSDSIIFPLSDRYPKLAALAQSHVVNFVNPEKKIRIRVAHCSVPARNLWARPMPRKRVKNLLCKWLEHLLDNLMPPLPEQEFSFLRDVVQGTIQGPCQPPRRAGSQLSVAKLEHWHLQHAAALMMSGRELKIKGNVPNAQIYSEIKSVLQQPAKTPTGRYQRFEVSPNLRAQMRDSLIGHSLTTDVLRRKKTPVATRVITSRSLRKMYNRIFSESCMATWDSAEKAWTFQWGVRSSAKTDESVSAQYMECLDSIGKLTGLNEFSARA